jgi:hypothetical protein
MTSFKVDALAAIVSDSLLSQPNHGDYSWQVSETAWEALGTGFDHKQYVEPHLNVELKKHLAECWAVADARKKFELAKWIISSWGGINGNKDETIKRHISVVEADNINAPFEGIASYSKIFSIKAPNRYAIYDARVATSLNAIQLISGKHIFAFPIPPGRNGEIDQPNSKGGFSDIYTRKYLVDVGFAAAPRRATYKLYLELLEGMRRTSNLSVLHWEMQLFSRAVELSRAARVAHPV